MCSADPGNLQGIGIDHPACNIQNDHFSACGEQWGGSNSPPNPANPMGYSRGCGKHRGEQARAGPPPSGPFFLEGLWAEEEQNPLQCTYLV